MIKPRPPSFLLRAFKNFLLKSYLREEGKFVPKYVTIATHLSLDELAHRYRKAVDPAERSHFHIIWLLAQGKRVSEVALVTDYCPNWIRILLRRYNQDGPQILTNHKPVLRRVWARKGPRPIVRVQHRYQWLYVYGFVCPESGETHWLLLPTVSIEVFVIALAHFARAVGAGSDRRIILTLDCAGWHSSQTLVIPDGIHLVFLPPYSPELQPSERLWPLSNEAIANRHFKTLDKLQEMQAERCIALQNDPICVVTSLSSIGGLLRSHKSNMVSERKM